MNSKNIKILMILMLCSLYNVSKAQLSADYVLTQKEAYKIMYEALLLAKSLKAPGGSIAVAHDVGKLILLERLDNKLANASEVSIAKVQTAALFKKKTQFFEKKINGERPALITMGPNILKGDGEIVTKKL